MKDRKRNAKLPESTASRREDLLARWVAKAKSELPIAPDEMDAWLYKLEECLKVTPATPPAPVLPHS